MRERQTMVIVIHPEAAGVDALPESQSEEVANALAFHGEYWHGMSCYHRDGLRYVISPAMPKRPLGRLSRVLAATFYNPLVRVRHRYRQGLADELPQLRDPVAAAIRADDAIILTQINDAEEMARLLASTAAFDDVAAALRMAATGPRLTSERTT